MNRPITKDTLISQIPSHIFENYPKFFEFLEAYYEWINQDGNPYERIKNHLSYLDFSKSIDSYVDFMKQEYLSDVPDSVLLDKELFIKWSKKFNIARGSHNSYKFLFSVLYDEQDTEIYLPKENILRTSDGVWIDNESRLIVTNSGSLNLFQFSRITQTKEPFPGVFEYAYANVQSARNRYSGGYNVLELTVSDVEGTFEKGYPIETELGASEWLIDSVANFNVIDGGSGYREGSRVLFQDLGRYEVEREAGSNGTFDTRVTSFFKPSDITVNVNGSSVTTFEFDGRTVTSGSISAGDTVTVTFPPYEGYMIVDCTQINQVLDISILEAPIGVSSNEQLVIDSVEGTGFDAQAIKGFLSPIVGYYENNRGQLSSTMYLQDGFYYQEYSYAIRTQQSLEDYGEIVKRVLHPAGFELFGYLRIIDIIELLIELISSEYEILPFETESRAKYSLGPNYSFFEKFKHGLSGRLYNMSHFQDKPLVDAIIEPRVYMDDGIIENLGDYLENNVYKPSYSYRFDMEMAVGEQSEYNLEDDTLSKTYIAGVGGYIEEGYIDDDFYQDIGNWNVPVKGWMTKHYLQDYHLYIPQDYTEEVESGFNYFETGYVSERAA